MISNCPKSSENPAELPYLALTIKNTTYKLPTSKTQFDKHNGSPITKSPLKQIVNRHGILMPFLEIQHIEGNLFQKKQALAYY